jgi:tetratricopeptide (TPR) repeat protein
MSLKERANLYRNQGKYADAESLYLRSIQIFEKSPDENPNIRPAMEDYILLLRKMSRTEQALKVENRLNEIRQKK